MPITSARTQQQGFGIVVVALLFTAFATIAAFMLDRSSVQLEMERQTRVQAQLTRLNIAMARFARNTDHRMPCPAALNVPPSNASFGSAVATCDAVDPPGVSSNGRLLFGMVPVQALIPYGVAYDDAFDPWGSRILYVVDRDVTSGTSAATVAGATDAQRPLISDYITGETVVPGPDTVLVSFGRDKMGGYLRGQASLAGPSVACGAGRRAENCNNDRIFTRGPLFTGSRTAVGFYFDDTISSLRYTN